MGYNSNILYIYISNRLLLILPSFLLFQEKEYLPVRSLHFGDTGTPLDRNKAALVIFMGFLFDILLMRTDENEIIPATD